MNLKVSLVIPVYNIEKYISRCLDSAIGQTLTDIEVIVVDDGSTDECFNIALEYRTKDSRIKVYKQSNQGQGYARNLAICKASGEYIFCLDGDDWIEENTLEKLYNKSQKQNADVIICGWRRIDEKTNKIIQTRQDILSLNDYSKETILKEVFSARLNLMACACLIKREIFTENYLIYPNVFHEDLYVMPKVFYYANKILIEKNDLYNWLIREKSTTNSATKKHVLGICGALYDWKLFLYKENVIDKYEKEYIQAAFTYFNVIIHRIERFNDDSIKKNELYSLIADVMLSLYELRKYVVVLNKEEIKKLKKAIDFYETVVGGNNNHDYRAIDEFNLENVALKSQLNDVYASNGYRFLKKYYNYRDRYLPEKSKRRSIVKKITSLLVENDSRSNVRQLSPKKIEIAECSYDVIFLPHKDYQVWTMSLIARELKKVGISTCLMDLTDYYRDEGSREEAKKYPDVPFKDLKLLTEAKIDYNALICMNDWDTKVNRPLIIGAKDKGKITIGIVEGIQDFMDLDTGRERRPYQYVEYVFLTGEHDKRFFKEKLNKTYIVGVPRLQELLEEIPSFPENPLAVINVNFSYQVLIDKRMEWLDSAIKGCELANIEYIITQHPADTADLSQYNCSQKNMYDTIRQGSIVISRFSSTIIESLAMGKPAVYHNPHGEKAVKFQEPMGAYSLSFDSNSLAKAIEFELSLNLSYRQRANKFLHHHCNINSKHTSAYLAAKAIQDAL